MESPSRSPRRRWRQLVLPGLQMRLVGRFVGLALLGILLQLLILARRLPELAREMETTGQLSDAVPGVLVEVFVFSILIVAPILVGFGILFTFRIAGPLVRFQRHFEALARGEDPGACRLRGNDELQDLCEQMNVAFDAVRRGRAERVEEPRRKAG